MRNLVSIALFLLGAIAAASAAEPAMLFYVSGRVEAKHGGAAWRSARALQRLAEGAQVRCGSGAKAGVLLIDTGERFEVSGASPATIRQNGVEGARSLGRPAGLSVRAAQRLAGARTGALLARPPVAPRDLVYKFEGWL